MRKEFSVYINEQKYWVYDIEGKEHEGLNGEPTTWWLYYSDELPSDLLPAVDSEYLVPYQNSINRLCWEINIKQKNGHKHKWGSYNFSCHTSVQMICNGKLVYEFGVGLGTDGLSYAMAKVQYLQVQLVEHPYNFFEPETEEGRKIYFYGLPATIKPSSWAGEIRIIPDYSTGLTEKNWWAKYNERRSTILSYEAEDAQMEQEDFIEDQQYGSINWGSALEDAHINWFR